MCGKDNSPASIFTPDCPLVTTRQENEFRLAMADRVRQESCRVIDAEFEMPIFSTQLAADAAGVAEVAKTAENSEAADKANVAISSVKPATNAELGVKVEVAEYHDSRPPVKFVNPQWRKGIEEMCRDFNERMNRIAGEVANACHPLSKLLDSVDGSKPGDDVDAVDGVDANDIHDAEHPYMYEEQPLPPAGQDRDLPVDYRYLAAEGQRQVHDLPCPCGGTKQPPMPPVESEAMPAKESQIALDELDASIGALEFRFDELLKGVKDYNDKIAGLTSDVEFLKEDNSALTGKLYQHDSALALLGKELTDLRKASETKTGGVNVEGGQSPMGVLFFDGEPIVGYDHPFPQPSFPAGQPGKAATPTHIADASDAREHINPTLDPSKIHPHRFIAYSGLVIDTALNREYQSNDAAFDASALNSGQTRAIGTSTRIPSPSSEHCKAFRHVDWLVANESIPLYRAMEYIFLGGEMFDPVSFDLNSYLKGESKSKPLDRTQTLCIAIEWLRVALRERVWDARREAEREGDGWWG